MNRNGANSDAANPLEEVHVEVEHIQTEEDENDEDSGENDGEISHMTSEIDGDNVGQGMGMGPYSGNSTHLMPPPPQLLQQQKVQLFTRVQGKRTVILPHQKKILEEFYSTGMVSASHNLHHLHEAAADQTGLELYVIKNWVRNRRRPSAAQKRQEIHEVGTQLANSQLVQQSPLTSLSNIPISNNITTVTLPNPIHAPHTPPILTIPEAKRICFDGSNSSKLITVKVRIADSGETDFIEVDVHTLSYIDLLRNICEELEVSPDDVSKIRKLPNVLIRKDKDISRLENGQELELVLRGGGVNNSSIQQIMTLNPFPGTSSVQLIPLMSTADSNTLLTLENAGQGANDSGGSNHS